jgi:hypothetical protein
VRAKVRTQGKQIIVKQLKKLLMEKYFKISYKIGNAGFELESSEKDWIEIKEKEYLEKLSHQKISITASEGYVKSSKPMDSSKISESITVNEFYREYMKKLDLTSRQLIALFFVYYLEKIQKKTDIKSSDVITCFREIAYPNYSNLNMTDILHQAKRKAFLNNVNNYWSLTITGEDYVLNMLSGENNQ